MLFVSYSLRVTVESCVSRFVSVQCAQHSSNIALTNKQQNFFFIII